jgi:hypothetical protein
MSVPRIAPKKSATLPPALRSVQYAHHMKSPKLLLLFCIALGSLVTGCTTKTSRDSSIPWTRPASWEGGIPGMGNPDAGR